MVQAAGAGSTMRQVASAEAIRHVAGAVGDHTVAEILALAPSADDLDIACFHAQGLGDLLASRGHPLTGTSARIYEILLADEAYRPFER